MAFRVGQLVMFNKKYMAIYQHKFVKKGKKYCFVKRRNQVARIVELHTEPRTQRKPEVIAKLDVPETMHPCFISTAWLRPLR